MTDCFTCGELYYLFYSNNFYFNISVFMNLKKKFKFYNIKTNEIYFIHVPKCSTYNLYTGLLQLQIHKSQFKVQYILMRFCAV